jgi:hypothetical protein
MGINVNSDRIEPKTHQCNDAFHGNVKLFPGFIHK